MFALSSIYAYADQIELTHVDVNNRISPGETADFTVTVKNNMKIEEEFALSVNELDVYPFSNLIESAEVNPNVIKLKAGESKNVKVSIKIFQDASPNVNYKTFVNVRASSNPNIKNKEYLVVSVLSPDNLIGITTNFPDKVVAGPDQEFNFTLNNKVNMILKDLEYSVSSEFFQESKKINLYYGLPLVKTMHYKLDSSTKPGIYKLSIKAIYNNKVRGSLVKTFEVEKNPKILEKDESESGFLVTRYKFERENNGNLVMEESVVLPLAKIESYFTSANIRPSKQTNVGYEWTFTLKPGEIYKIDAKTDYRIIFYGSIIIILFAIVLWYYLHKTVAIKKQLYHVNDRESGISELKVILRIKNKGNPLRHIRVVDIIPGLLKPSSEYGTLKPSEVQKTYTGTRLVWDISLLDIGDERILSYKLESKTNLFSTIILPPAAVIYKKLSKKITKMSNKVVFVPRSKNKKKLILFQSINF